MLVLDQSILMRYRVIKELGRGSYGQVFMVRSMQNDQLLALKRVVSAFQNKTDAKRTYRQTQYLNQLKHPNIVRLLHVHLARNKMDLYMVFEYMQADLSLAIHNKILTVNHIQILFYNLLKGLVYLHSGKALHRDIKPANLLIDQNCMLKICDFGLIRPLQSLMTQRVGTRWYRAPQILLGSQNYTQAADMWSVGCVLAQCILFQPLFPGQIQLILDFTGLPSQDTLSNMGVLHSQAIVQHCFRGVRFQLKKRLAQKSNDSLNRLVLSLLNLDPKKRPSAQQTIKHSFFRSLLKKNEIILRSQPFRVNFKQLDLLNANQYRNKLQPQSKISSRISARMRLSLNKNKSQILSSTRDSIFKQYSLQKVYNKKSFFQRQKSKPSKTILKKKTYRKIKINK